MNETRPKRNDPAGRLEGINGLVALRLRTHLNGGVVVVMRASTACACPYRCAPFSSTKGGIRWSQGANRNDVRDNEIIMGDGDDFALYFCENFSHFNNCFFLPIFPSLVEIHLH